MILKALDEGTLQTVENFEEELRQAKEAAKNYFKKNTRINIRLPLPDVLRIKGKAAERGIPYQTLIASILHQFASGQIE
jgi:predicted DNA binding CopG/RHH family protein